MVSCDHPSRRTEYASRIQKYRVFCLEPETVIACRFSNVLAKIQRATDFRSLNSKCIEDYLHDFRLFEMWHCGIE